MIGFDITEVENYKEVCLATQKEATSFFSPPLLECNGEYICLGNKTYLIVLLMGNNVCYNEIKKSNYTRVYEDIKRHISDNGNYGVSIEKKDIKKHIGLKVFISEN